MLISGTVTIAMVGGVAPYGQSGSSMIMMNPVISMIVRPVVQTSGQPFVGGAMTLSPRANVIHSAEVSINDPNVPS